LQEGYELTWDERLESKIKVKEVNAIGYHTVYGPWCYLTYKQLENLAAPYIDFF